MTRAALRARPDPLVVKRQSDLFDLFTDFTAEHSDDPDYDPDDDPAFVEQARRIMGLPSSGGGPNLDAAVAARSFAAGLADTILSRGVDTHPGGEQLKHWWTKDPEGLKLWAFSPHPWQTLYDQLLPHLKNPDRTARVTETWYRIVFGGPSGWRKGDNPLGPG